MVLCCNYNICCSEEGMKSFKNVCRKFAIGFSIFFIIITTTGGYFAIGTYANPDVTANPVCVGDVFPIIMVFIHLAALFVTLYGFYSLRDDLNDRDRSGAKIQILIPSMISIFTLMIVSTMTQPIAKPDDFGYEYLEYLVDEYPTCWDYYNGVMTPFGIFCLYWLVIYSVFHWLLLLIAMFWCGGIGMTKLVKMCDCQCIKVERGIEGEIEGEIV